MKRFLVSVIGAAFFFAFAASAFAIHAEIPADTQAVVAKSQIQITLGGDIRSRGRVEQNTDDFNSDKADHKTFYDSRVRLHLGAKITPNTEGFIEVEAGNGPDEWNYKWGNEDINQGTGFYNEGERARGQFSIIQAWIQYKGKGLLGIPAGVKVGHMPIVLGNKLFFAHYLFGDDALVFFADPTKELHTSLLTIKLREGNVKQNDDSNAYMGIFDYRTKNFGVSGDVTYIDDQNYFLGINGRDAHLWNFGLRGDAKISGLRVRGDVEAQAGRVIDAAGNEEAQFRGYAFLGGLDYNIHPAVKLSLDYVYGSGDDNDSDKKIGTFVTALSNTQITTYVYSRFAVNAANRKAAGVANTQYVKLGADAKLAKNLRALLGIYWLRAVKNYFGAPYLIPGQATDSKDIGIEVDWKFTYHIDRNLQYWVEGGYLFAGDFWKVKTGGKDPDNAYGIRHGIMLSF